MLDNLLSFSIQTSGVLHWVLGIPLGLFAANAGEWVVHKHLLHGLGRNKRSFWAFHWHQHHRESRRQGMLDPDYTHGAWCWNARTKELVALGMSFLLSIPLLWIVPGFAAAVLYAHVGYYIKHRRSHRDPEWARENLPWHVDHHLGPNQDANWCVTRPWFDLIMGTREPFVESLGAPQLDVKATTPRVTADPRSPS